VIADSVTGPLKYLRALQRSANVADLSLRWSLSSLKWEASENVSVLQVDKDTYQLHLEVVGFVYHVVGILLGMVAGFFKVLVVLNGSTNMEGELGTDNMVNGISKVVKEDDLIVFKRGAGIINWDDLQDAMVNGIIFSKGCVYFRVVRMNVVI
jgi:hypothetical protein